MARKTREEALETREQLLDAAEKVFRTRGVGHASLAEVADAAGLTRGAVYWHFKDKAALFQALVDRAGLPMDQAVEEMAAQQHADPLGAVRQLAIRALTQLVTNRRAGATYEIVFLRCEFTEEMSAVQKRHREDRSECLKHCVDAFARAIELGQLPAGTDATLAALAMYAYVGGLMRDWVESPGEYDLEASAPVLVDLFLAGLKANPPRTPSAPPRTRRASRKGATAKTGAGEPLDARA